MYDIYHKYTNKIVRANSVDPDLTAPWEVFIVWYRAIIYTN